ncbi:MAG: hypothetical protein M3032_00650, partial [Verrucomicrobiota bacterium]|nr:hypothetical protein [Verrucomicrobiota bacterium]
MSSHSLNRFESGNNNAGYDATAATELCAGAESVRSAVRERRRARVIRFIVLESIALILTVASVCAGLSVRFADDSLTPIFRFLPVTCAVLAGL